jgi:hypothetical protein
MMCSFGNDVISFTTITLLNFIKKCKMSDYHVDVAAYDCDVVV